MKRNINEVLINLLSFAVGSRKFCESDFLDMNDDDWKSLYRLSCKQGVAAIVFNAIVSAGSDKVMISSALKYQWISKTLMTEKYINNLTTVSDDVATVLGGNELSMLVLKGVSYGLYYDNPSHREFGDLDCYVGRLKDGGYEWGSSYSESNNILASKGAVIYDRDYKHSHLHFRDINIENHLYCLPVLNDARLVELEAFLNTLLQTEGVREIPGTSMLRPSATFTAIFMISHAFSHFLIEGIKLKHICDWIAFLKAEQNDVDWASAYIWYDKMGYKKFVDALNHIARNHFMLSIESPILTFDERYSQMILDDCFRDTSVYNKRYTLLKSRIAKIRNIYNGRWKFKYLYGVTPSLYMVKLGINYMRHGILIRKKR